MYKRMKQPNKSVAIIGWGFGWLASAILLAKDGYQVDVYEKNECLGWRASIFEAEGFRFDMGPSWYLMPDVFAEFFTRIGENVEDHLTLTPLDPTYRIFFEDDTIIDMCSDPKRAAKIIDQLEPGAMEKFFDYLTKSEFQYEIGMKFVYKNYDSIFDFLTREIAKEWSKLRVFSNLHKYVKRFFKTKKVQQIMMYTLVFLGTSPYQAPALYNIMSHVDFNLWLFYPQGGIHKIVRALEKIGKKHGVKYHLNSPATNINVNNGSATSVDINGKQITADIILCNADQARAETTLLDTTRQTYPKKYRDKKTFGPSWFIAYLGINKPLPELTHHNLIFRDDRTTSFDQIFKDKILPTEPSIYICNPSKTDPTVAPKWKENMFMLVPIPSGIEITPETEQIYKQKAYETIEKYCNISFQDHIIYEKLFHVKDFEERYNARTGTALGLAHTLMQTAIFRPNNISKKVDNLFYVGHNTNPWIGMPMVLISSILAHERITKKYGTT